MWKLGIDIGGTTVKGALFQDGDVVKRDSVATCGGEGREAILRQLFFLTDRLFVPEVAFIGVASAGNIDPDTGTCLYATDNLLGWTGTQIAALVSERYHRPCRADNDAVCALFGEMRLLPKIKDATMLTLGTGVGGASVVNGSVLRGADFSAARWGHVVIEPNGICCNCGKRGCSEQYLSATALLKAGRAKIPDLESCKDLFDRYRREEKQAKEVLRNFCTHLNALLDMIETVLAPEIVLIGGGVASSQDVLKDMIGNGFRNVTFAQLGGMAGVYGASYLNEINRIR